MCTALREWAQEEREAGRIEGRTAGRAEGRMEGRAAINELITFLVSEDRIEDLSRASRDYDYQEKLLNEYKIKH